MKDIVMMPIKAIKPYANNPRHNAEAVDKVASSIREFGFQQPIVVDKDNVIIVGHTRLEASKKLKLKEVPVVVADDLTEEQVRAYRVADNKTAEFSDWDKELLSMELDSIADIDMTDFGFDLDEFSFNIDDIEDFDGYDKNNDDRKYFEKAFTFPIEKKEPITRYLKKHLQEITDDIIRKADEDNV